MVFRRDQDNMRLIAAPYRLGNRPYFLRGIVDALRQYSDSSGGHAKALQVTAMPLPLRETEMPPEYDIPPLTQFGGLSLFCYESGAEGACRILSNQPQRPERVIKEVQGRRKA